MESKKKPFVLFVCRHNTGRSQMAEAFLRRYTGSAVQVASAGTEAAEFPNAGVVAAMAEDGIDISTARPKLISPDMMRADRIITMGCDVRGIPRIDDDWVCQIQMDSRQNEYAKSGTWSKRKRLYWLRTCSHHSQIRGAVDAFEWKIDEMG